MELTAETDTPAAEEVGAPQAVAARASP